ncbi:MAG: LCP family protein [Clostridiales bacterium]|nr:LCP family protein [Clostridiales bacterium]
MKEKTNQSRHFPRSRGAKIALISAVSLLGLLLLLFTSTGVYLWMLFGKVTYDDGSGSESYVDSLPEEEDDDLLDPSAPDLSNPGELDTGAGDGDIRGNTADIVNYLLIGVDNRGSMVGRSDVNMIVSVNTKTHTLRLVSLLRDLWVTIPGRGGYHKLNAAYAYGGFDLLSQTLQQNFRLKIDQYIAVDFSAFEKAVEALGGVDIELTAAEARHIHVGDAAGSYHLNGAQALAYARIRKLDSDFGRTARQRKVMTALIGKVSHMDLLSLNSLLLAVLPQVKTNLSQSELMGLTGRALTWSGYTVEQYAVPQSGDYQGTRINGGAGLWLTDRRQSVQKLLDFLYA